jgi:hypothetical protein
MAKKKLWLGVLVVLLGIQGLTVIGCASIQPMSDEAIRNYSLNVNPGNFENFQYYVSRDIVLTYVSATAQSTAIGQISVNRDIIQILSSTPGVVLEVTQDRYGYRMLGVAFEASDDDLLWFVQNPAKAGTYFYLAYTNESTGEINYGGYPYTVSYEQATGVGASVKRLNPFSKVKKGEYDNMEPILLYEEKIKESQQKRTVQGRKL